VKCIPTLYDSDFPINITEKSYLDLFPKENIVYLTPHCREELREFDHDAIYIIGAMVDKGNSEPLSLAKAKREGLKMAKLPLDKYLMWGSGRSKTLTLNQIMRILLDVRTTGSWEKALQHVPRRKIVTTEQLQEQCLKKKERPRQRLCYTIKDRSNYY
jgi:ribonuclease P protein 1